MSYLHHILIVPVPGRSHVRLLSQLAFNILAIHPTVCVTFFMTPIGIPMLEEDISLQSTKWKQEMEGRHRVVVRGEAMEEGPPSAKMAQIFDVFPEFWQDVSAGGKEGFDKSPCFVIADLFVSSISKTIQGSANNVPLLPFFASTTLASHGMFRSDAEGGVLVGLKARYERYLEEGMDKEEAVMKAYRNVQNRLFHFPDLPPMYDYEFTPQSLARDLDESTVMFMDKAYQTWSSAKGGVYLAVPELESEGLKDMAQRSEGQFFGVGPQLNESAWVKSEERAVGKVEYDEIFAFLDRAQKEQGENSAVYISFGTNFWPTKRYEIIEWIVESLLSHEPLVPFVFATPTQDGKIDPALKSRITDSGRGIVVDWCPQVQVLQHPAVGMFLSHCGSGSLTEAIVCGVPIVALPFGADQPAHAAFCESPMTPLRDTTKHKCGSDLRELKTGFAGLPLGDGYVVKGTKEAAMAELHGVWDRLQGDNGEDIRDNVRKMKEIWHKSWTEGGSRKAVENFSQFFH